MFAGSGECRMHAWQTRVQIVRQQPGISLHHIELIVETKAAHAGCGGPPPANALEHRFCFSPVDEVHYDGMIKWRVDSHARRGQLGQVLPNKIGSGTLIARNMQPQPKPLHKNAV